MSDIKLCKNCKHSVLTSQVKLNPRFEREFYSWNSEYSCLKFAEKVTDVVTGDVYYNYVTSCRDNRKPFLLFKTRCTPDALFYEDKYD